MEGREEGCELSCSLKLPHWRTMSQHYLSLIVDETFYQLNKTETNTIRTYIHTFIDHFPKGAFQCQLQRKG